MSKITRTSNTINFIFKSLIILYPAVIICMWFGLIAIPSGFFTFSRLPIVVDFGALEPSIQLAGCAIQLLSAIATIMGFYYLSQLFTLYSKNIIFSLQNMLLIRKIGYTFVAQVLVSIMITQPVLSFVLTKDAIPGQRFISSGIGSDEISNLLIAGIVILISWIMAEGRKLADEQALTI